MNTKQLSAGLKLLSAIRKFADTLAGDTQHVKLVSLLQDLYSTIQGMVIKPWKVGV